MSNNAISDLGRTAQVPDDPQETLDVRNYYYAGFLAAEMTCSVIRATNYNPRGHYYAVDLTVSNADKELLEDVNTIVMRNRGCICAIKGGYNLKTRGKENVRIALAFLKRYPILAGDLARNRIVLLEEALTYLDAHKGHAAHAKKTQEMERIRAALRSLKTGGTVLRRYSYDLQNIDAAGHFLAGLLDGEASFSVRRRANGRSEPFMNMAMKDRKAVELLQEVVGHGTVRKRSDGLYHFEVNKQSVLLYVCQLFLSTYPLRHARQKRRLESIQRILNDHTPSPSSSSRKLALGDDMV